MFENYLGCASWICRLWFIHIFLFSHRVVTFEWYLPRMLTWCFTLYCLDKYQFDYKDVVSVCKGRQNSTCVEEHFVGEVSYGPWTQQLAAPLAARRTDTHEAGPSPAGRKQTHKWWGELRFWSHTNCSGGNVSLLSLSEALVLPKLGAAGGRSIWMHPAGMLRWL